MDDFRILGLDAREFRHYAVAGSEEAIIPHGRASL
jgi:hypothetical protein